MNIADWCNRVIRWSFGLLFVLVPLIVIPSNYELFEFNKMMVTYALTVGIVTAWITKALAQKELVIRRTPLDIPIALFFFSQLLSSLFSMDPHVSWFGYYSRFNGGMISVISYILLYYAFVSNVPHWSHVTNLLKLLLGSAVVVSLYAFLEHFGYSISCLLFTGKLDVTCWVQDVQNRVFATLGQPNWLAAYLAALIPLTIAFGFQCQMSNAKCRIGENIKRISFIILHSAFIILFFTVLLFTKSRSGLIGFAVADAIFWLLIFLKNARTKFLYVSLLTYHVSLFAIIFFVGTNIDILDRFITKQGLQHQLQKTQSIASLQETAPKTDTLLSTGGTESSVIRSYVWQGAVAAWKRSVKTIVVGTGTETFAFSFYQHKPIGHNLTSEWDFLYNKAHNEYLNYLATTGIFGLGSYLLFIGTFIYWFVSRIKYHVSSKNMIPDTLTLDTALFSGWISILITNFFGFSVVIMQVLLFLFPAMIIAAAGQKKEYVYRFNPSTTLSRLLQSTVLLFGLFFLYLLSRLWIADTNYASGYHRSRSGEAGDAHVFLLQAIHGNPLEPVYYDEDSIVLAQLANAQMEAQDATAAAILAKQSLMESDRAITISPNNVNFWKSRTKLFVAFSSFDRAFTKAALTALERAWLLAPTDPKITYNLGILYWKLEDVQKAETLMKQTIDLKPDYRDAYVLLLAFYQETKRPDRARSIVEEYLKKVDPNDKNFQDQLKNL